MTDQLVRSWQPIQQKVQSDGCLPTITTDRPTSDTPTITLQVREELFSKRESYKLQIRDGNISLTGADPLGLFYATLTLVQMFKHYAKHTAAGVELPPVLVTDWPDLARRGAMLDLRTKCLGLPKLCSTAEMLSTLKVNELHLYLESCYLYSGHQTTSHNHVHSVGTGLTAADLVSLRQHCHRLGIVLVLHQASRVMPSWLQHAEHRALAQCPQSKHPQTLSLTNPKSLELVLLCCLRAEVDAQCSDCAHC